MRQMTKTLRLLFGVCLLSAIVLIGANPVFAATKNFNKTPTVSISDTEAHYVSGEYTWIKYKAPQNGYITITASFGSRKYTHSQGYWRLYSSNKKTALSEKETAYSIRYDGAGSKYERQSVYGVKKGKTYYLRVKAYDGVRLNCKFKQVKEKCASKRTKASLLKKNKNVTGLILPKDKKKDWYKIQIKKAQRIQLYFYMKSDGAFKVTFCSPIGTKLASKKYSYTGSTVRIVIDQYSSLKKKRTPLNAGTYYIKVEPVNKYSSGYYKLKWK